MLPNINNKYCEKQLTQKLFWKQFYIICAHVNWQTTLYVKEMKWDLQDYFLNVCKCKEFGFET